MDGVILRLSGPHPRGGTDDKHQVARHTPKGPGDPGAAADGKGLAAVLPREFPPAPARPDSAHTPHVLQGDLEVIQPTSPRVQLDPMREWRSRRTASKPQPRPERRTTLLRQVKRPQGAPPAG